MPDFKFTRLKDKFVFGNDVVKIVYSKPSIQGFSESSTLHSYKDIMYYYYCVEYYHTVYDKKDNPKMVKVASIHTYDFPGLLLLADGFEAFLNINRDKFQKNIRSNFRGQEEIFRTYCWNVDGEDSYELTYIDDDEPHFRLTATASKQSYAINGLRINYMSLAELLEFKKCIDAFIEYSIQKENRTINVRNSEFSSQLSIKNNRLYVIDSMKNVHNICKPGDVISIIIAHRAENGEWAELYKDCAISDWTIARLSGDTLTLTADEISIDVPLCDIVYLNQEANEEQINYDLEKISDDFCSVMTDEDVSFFKESDVLKIVARYFNAIINRTWMCREEHNFCEGYKGGIKEVVPFVGEVVKKIKSKIN